MTFMLGTCGTANSSQRAGLSGLSCRRTRILTVCGILRLLVAGAGGGVDPLARRDQRCVDRLIGDDGAVLAPGRPRRLQEPRVVALRELGLVVRAPALVAAQGAQRDH